MIKRVVFLLLCLSVTPAFAQSGDDLLKKGEALLAEGNLDDALSKLRESVNALTDADKKARAHLLLGIIYLARDEVDNTRKEFNASIRLRPSHQVDEAQFAPDVVQLFNQERNKLLGSISISTEPSEASQAEVYLNDELKGLSPVELEDLLAGDYTLKVVKEGFKTIERRETVNASEKKFIPIEMQVDDKITPKIVHKKGEDAIEGTSYRVRAEVTDNVGLDEVLLHFRMKKDKKYSTERMVKVQEGIWEGIVSSEMMKGEKLKYFITAEDTSNNYATEGNEEAPFEILVIHLDKEPPVIFHDEKVSSSDASKLIIEARVIDNEDLDLVILGYRAKGVKKYIVEKMPLKVERVEKDGGKEGDKSFEKVVVKDTYSLEIPGSYVNKTKLVEYYIEAKDKTGNKQYSGRPNEPNDVVIYRVAPYYEGFVVERKEIKKGKWSKEVRINLGSSTGVKKGDIFTVFRTGDCDKEPFKGCVKDPETGEVLKIDQVVTGTIQVGDAGPRSSMAKVLKESKKDRINVNHKIRRHPSAVQNLTGNSFKLRQVDLTWSESPEPETEGYIVYRSDSLDVAFEKLRMIKGRSKKKLFDKKKLKDETIYYYKVSAYNKQKAESPQSEPVAVMTKGGPNPPVAFKGSTKEIRQISLKWEVSGDKDAIGYIIQRAEKPEGPFADILKLSNVKTIKTVIKSSKEIPLIDGQRYYFRMLSYNKLGKNGNPSETAVAFTRGKPPVPTGLQVVSERVRSVSLSWDMHPDPDVIGYNVHRSESKEGTFGKIKSIKVRTVTEFTDKGAKLKLKDGVEYFYAISSVREGNIESDLSETAIGIPTGAPDVPTGVKATRGLVKRVALTWDEMTKPDIGGYKVYRSEDGVEFKSLKKIIGKGKTQYTDSQNLKDGATYYYGVTSYNIVNVESKQTDAVEGATKPLPEKPQGLGGADGEARQTHLAWQPNPEGDINEYRLWRSLNADKGFSVLARIKGDKTTYNDLRLQNGKQYYYQITAVDKDGLVSEPSDVVFITTKQLPLPPSQAVATPGTTSVALKWEKSESADVESYNIYSKGFFSPKIVGTTKETSFVVEKLKPNQSHNFFVTAVDSAGLESKASENISVTTLK